MQVLVVGATGGSGRATVEELLRRGHEVTAFSRRAHALRDLAGSLRTVEGDATRPEDLHAAVEGQDGVVVALGISEHPVRVRLLGSAGTPMDVRSRGTKVVIDAMRRHGVRRLVVQSTYGVGETSGRLPLLERAVFSLLLRPQIVDTERQEEVVRTSGMDWVLAQPVNLTDDPTPDSAFASETGEVAGMRVSRRQVARFLVDAVEGAVPAGRSVSLSGTAPAPAPMAQS